MQTADHERGSRVNDALAMKANPIEDYAVIGDGRTAALVHRRGSIDWLCWPRFDSSACFASLLGNEEHGCWQLGPVDPRSTSERRYVDNTLVLETVHATRDGRVRVTDFMPIDVKNSSVVRLVHALDSDVPMAMRIALRFDYGRVQPWVENDGRGFTATVGPSRVRLDSPIDVSADEKGARIEFTAPAGKTLAFILTDEHSDQSRPVALDASRLLKSTKRHWNAWIGRFTKQTDWPLSVRRSLLVLHAMVHRSTGAVLAAPTTSLPEVAGGDSNWDYRYCWLRDATFTISTFLNAGLHKEAEAWRDWLLRAVGAEPEKLRIAYRVDGDTNLDERRIDWLPGYENAVPVRVGNAAWSQHQVDVYGELLNALALARKAGVPQCPQGRHVEASLVLHLEKVWDTPGHGLWEDRGDPKHYVYSKVMAWVGVDCYLKGAKDTPLDAATIRRLTNLREQIHTEICEKGFHLERGSFVQHYDSEDLDASLLLLPILEFLPIDDSRMVGTIAAIERELMRDGFVMRLPRKPGGKWEGAFLACTCWLADCMQMQGRHAKARETFERVLSVANDVHLLSEEYDVTAHRLAGNFPQTLTHLAVVNTALGLMGPVLQRGGG